MVAVKFKLATVTSQMTSNPEKLPLETKQATLNPGSLSSPPLSRERDDNGGEEREPGFEVAKQVALDNIVT